MRRIFIGLALIVLAGFSGCDACVEPVPTPTNPSPPPQRPSTFTGYLVIDRINDENGNVLLDVASVELLDAFVKQGQPPNNFSFASPATVYNMRDVAAFVNTAVPDQDWLAARIHFGTRSQIQLKDGSIQPLEIAQPLSQGLDVAVQYQSETRVEDYNKAQIRLWSSYTGHTVVKRPNPDGSTSYVFMPDWSLSELDGTDGHYLSGSVIDGGGKPVVGAHVLARLDWFSDIIDTHVGVTDASGSFALSPLMGAVNYALTVLPPAGGASLQLVKTVWQDNTTVAPIMAASGSNDFSVSVTLASPASGLAQADFVEVALVKPDDANALYPVASALTASLAASQTLSFGNLPEPPADASYTARVVRHGYYLGSDGLFFTRHDCASTTQAVVPGSATFAFDCRE